VSKGVIVPPLRDAITPLNKVNTDKTIMPQDTDYKESKSENQAIAYRNRLNGWAIARTTSSTERVIIARFRTRSDADGYMQHISKLIPDASFELIFDSRREEVVI